VSIHLETIRVEVSLRDNGDAVISGALQSPYKLSGIYLKHRLFAWHAESFYGTDLTVEQIVDPSSRSQREVVILPKAMVIPFFADHELLEHIDWVWQGDAQWLIAIGGKSGTAQFRPVIQLLEPGELQEEPLSVSDLQANSNPQSDAVEQSEWRLRLVLQDKHDTSALVPIRLAGNGEVFGTWPSVWSEDVHERSAGWVDWLRACLPTLQSEESDHDVLGRPLDDESAWRFLAEDSQRLIESGWHVLLPAWWEAISRKKPRLRAKVRSKGAAASGKSLFGLESLIDFDWRIAIGDADLSESEFAQLVARNQRLVRFGGQWITLDPELLAQIRKAMANLDTSRGLSFQDVLQLHLLEAREAEAGENGDTASVNEERGLQLEVELTAQLQLLIHQLSGASERPKPPIPALLQAELRPYQYEGYAWLTFLRQFGLGGCLADDMGLGKTVQYIAYLLHLKEQAYTQEADAPSQAAPSLIVCPTSVLGNWQKELSRFGPALNIMLHYGNKRLEADVFYEAARKADVVLTSYTIAALDQELLKELEWSAICLDEAQNIKNAGTKQSIAVRSLPARHRIALTGTPIENRLSELWSIYDFITPGYLGSQHAFQQQFATAIEKQRDEARTADLQKLVRPFMLRRKKKDPAIQLDLPDKNEMKTYIHLTAEQGALYEQTVNELLERMQKLEGIERKGAILAALTHLKQLCDHPLLLTKAAMPELEDGQLDIAQVIERSAKLERLLDMVKELRDEGERCLIFTQYVGMGQMLQRVLSHELGERVLYLSGSTPKSGRDRMIEQFQAGQQQSSMHQATQAKPLPVADSPGVFVLSLKAGGVGLNLTAANHVFHFDRWWNPAVENQATDRAYRMGQKRDVQVHKFISLGTLEERIDEMLDNKQQLSDNVISSSEGWITELSTDELRDLFTLRKSL
jgi:SNF2 family DNA or RNA helicase